MTKTEIIKKILLEIFYFVKAYFTNYLFPKIKEAFLETKNYFIEFKNHFLEALWDKVREDLHEHLEMAIQEANEYFASASYEVKEKIVVDYIFDHIHLPLLLRPSKKVAEKMLKKKIRELISDKLDQLQKLNQVI